jgi:hypothetical protein
MKRAILFVVVGVLSGVLAHETWYLARRPPPPESLEEQLHWMRVQLHLNAEQYARIKALHEERGPRLRELGTEVAQTRVTLQEFEDRRRNVGQVDFLAYKEFVDQRRAVDRQAAESTREIVAAALSVMTAEQRARYLELLNPPPDPTEQSTFQ